VDAHIPHPEERAFARVSKDEGFMLQPSFEMHRYAMLLRMRSFSKRMNRKRAENDGGDECKCAVQRSDVEPGSGSPG
jgi:hypothetical protein